MPDPRAPHVPPRALRAGLAAGVAVGVAEVAHRAGHGAVDLTGAAWMFALLVGPAWWLGRRERGWVALVATQLAGQQIAHLALTVGSTHAVAGAALPLDAMLYAHLAGAFLTGVWLRAGERRAWRAARSVRRAVTVALARLLHPEPPPPAAAPAPRSTPPVLRSVASLLRHALARRGPPLTG